MTRGGKIIRKKVLSVQMAQIGRNRSDKLHTSKDSQANSFLAGGLLNTKKKEKSMIKYEEDSGWRLWSRSTFCMKTEEI